LIPLERIADALLVPAEAVVAGLDEKNVFVIKAGLAERRAVETGSRTATQVHIVSGLQPGDQVITSGLQQMRAKQPVESLPEKTSATGQSDKGASTDKSFAKPQTNAGSESNARSASGGLSPSHSPSSSNISLLMNERPQPAQRPSYGPLSKAPAALDLRSRVTT
jgi:hypothetical protein